MIRQVNFFKSRQLSTCNMGQNENTNYRNYCEKNLIEYCSPTLAGIKSASLFRIGYSSLELLQNEVKRINKLCRKKGLKIKLLKVEEGQCLVYVYRERLLNEILHNPQIWSFLLSYGYKAGDLDNILDQLELRMQTEDGFPHEIGIFLDYPYEDVKGFIDHTGKDCLFCGYWKVYQNEQAARTTFARYDACKENYILKFINGISLDQLVVAG